jgi:hypothetical protein
MGQQAHDIVFGHEIVAHAPFGMVDRLLQVNQQQDGPIRRLCRGAYVAAWLNAANTGWADAGSAGCGLAAAPFWKAVCLL